MILFGLLMMLINHTTDNINAGFGSASDSESQISAAPLFSNDLYLRYYTVYTYLIPPVVILQTWFYGF
jgi:hypothetical protein